MNLVSLARALSKLGVCSRTVARGWVEAGRVTVNGLLVHDPDAWIDMGKDKIVVDGAVARKDRLVYLAMHKPVGHVTTRADERGRKTVYDLLPAAWRNLFPIGRLDLDSSGLLLWTNDSRFSERVTNPVVAIEKEYRVRLDWPLRPEHVAAMQRPLELQDGTVLLPAQLAPDPQARSDRAAWTITIVEGKNRQIRRAFLHFGYRVEWLHRVRIGNIALGDTPVGEHRELRDDEVREVGGASGTS